MKDAQETKITKIAGLFTLFTIAALVLLFLFWGPKPTSGQKMLTIDITGEERAAAHYTVTTDAEYLQQALEEIPELNIEGTTTDQFGLMIVSVNGMRADFQTDGAYWAILLNGAPSNYGVSQQPITDGEHYTLEYTKAQP